MQVIHTMINTNTIIKTITDTITDTSKTPVLPTLLVLPVGVSIVQQ